MKIYLYGIALEVEAAAFKRGWRLTEMKTASTGSIYIEFVRDGREWVVIRVADHNQYYHRWITTYSMSPNELGFDEILDILEKPFGETGDVLL